MNTMLPISCDTIDALAASAFAKSRDCATAIRFHVLHHLPPRDRSGPERLLDAIVRRDIFDATFLAGIDELLGRIEEMILDGATSVGCRATDAGNVTAPAVWTKERHSRQGEDLDLALVVLIDFHETLLAEHDIVHAEQALARLRQAA